MASIALEEHIGLLVMLLLSLGLIVILAPIIVHAGYEYSIGESYAVAKRAAKYVNGAVCGAITAKIVFKDVYVGERYASVLAATSSHWSCALEHPSGYVVCIYRGGA